MKQISEDLKFTVGKAVGLISERMKKKNDECFELFDVTIRLLDALFEEYGTQASQEDLRRANIDEYSVVKVIECPLYKEKYLFGEELGAFTSKIVAKTLKLKDEK